MSVQEAIKIMEFLDYEGLNQYDTAIKDWVKREAGTPVAYVKGVNNNSAYTVNPNILNVLQLAMNDVGNIDILIQKGAEIEGDVNHYLIRFQLPEASEHYVAFNWDVKWYGDEEPTWIAGKIYEISIIDGLAMFAEF